MPKPGVFADGVLDGCRLDPRRRLSHGGAGLVLCRYWPDLVLKAGTARAGDLGDDALTAVLLADRRRLPTFGEPPKYGLTTTPRLAACLAGFLRLGFSHVPSFLADDP